MPSRACSVGANHIGPTTTCTSTHAHTPIHKIYTHTPPFTHRRCIWHTKERKTHSSRLTQYSRIYIYIHRHNKIDNHKQTNTTTNMYEQQNALDVYCAFTLLFVLGAIRYAIHILFSPVLPICMYFSATFLSPAWKQNVSAIMCVTVQENKIHQTRRNCVRFVVRFGFSEKSPHVCSGMNSVPWYIRTIHYINGNHLRHWIVHAHTCICRGHQHPHTYWNTWW